MAFSRPLNHDPDQILRPRPVKPLNPAVLRAQQFGDSLQVQDQQPGSGVSRFVTLGCVSSKANTSPPVDAQRPYLTMRRLQFIHCRQRRSKPERTQRDANIIQSTIPRGFPISMLPAITGTSEVSSSFSGSVSSYWFLQLPCAT